jgi:predicted NAD/FAD-binding protein
MRIGIVGGGAAGLTAAWLLESRHDVTLLEQAPRLGGHVDTVEVEHDGRRVSVEAGAEFFVESMFPTFIRLLRLLGVATRTYPITVTLHDAGGGRAVWLPPVRGGRGWPSLLRPGRLLEMLQLGRVLRHAARLVRARDTTRTVKDFLGGLGLTTAFRDRMLHPLLLGQWGVGRRDLERFAAYNVFKYMVLGRIDGRWTEMVGGTSRYVDALVRALGRTVVRRSTPVASVAREQNAYVVRDRAGHAQVFDQLVVATGAGEAARLLDGVKGAGERCRALQGIEHFPTTIAVHGDRRVMPARERDWSIVNFRWDGTHSLLTVWRGPRGRTPIFRSWITHDPDRLAALHLTRTYEHPMPTPGYFQTQAALAARQGEHGLWLAGLYTHDVDCHESAIVSAANVVRRLDPAAPNLTRLAPGPEVPV